MTEICKSDVYIVVGVFESRCFVLFFLKSCLLFYERNEAVCSVVLVVKCVPV